MSPSDNIGILYSTVSGIVLRTINPPEQEQGHLTWLQNNLPSGTSLLLLNKQAIGADDNNMPNLDTIIPHVQQNNLINLSYGIACSVVDSNNLVASVVLCAPELYQNIIKANIGSTLVQKPANVGATYNPITQTFTSPVKTGGTVL